MNDGATRKLYSGDAITGGDEQKEYLYYHLRESMRRAGSIDILVSFLMESGVRLIVSDLADALSRGARVRILTGNYLNITQPSALFLIKKELGEQVDLRFYNESGRSFHAKSYIFHGHGEDEIYIGSSNISRSALTSGIEWNYRFSSRKDPENFNAFYQGFEDLFYNHSLVIDDAVLRDYQKNWHRPQVYKDLDRYAEPDPGVISLYEPRGAQIEALYALEKSREEGADKALILAATGVGKTYIAAFDSKPYERVLFVAHREEILRQAAAAFRNVRGSEDFGFFTGKIKEPGKSVIFASVETLGRKEYLKPEFFAPDWPQYLVIDEFHHAVTSAYQNILSYFHPQFMLGLTATPERMDGRGIYELCDYNAPFEITLRDAINQGMLVPFHYYGVYDDTDYSGLHLVRGRYEEKELNETYIGNVRRYDLIEKYYRKYGSERALGFCCSREHAQDMAEQFTERNIPSAAVISGEGGKYSMERGQAIKALEEGSIKVLFTVDMFNEGVDIPDLDMVMFLRPTDSPVVFLQQLGRGLRKSRGKEYLNVLDFIGNYNRAGRVPLLLSGDGKARGNLTGESRDQGAWPDDCIVDFDMRLIDLFRQLQKRTFSRRERIDGEILRIREELGHVPSRMELFTGMEEDIYALCRNNSDINPFRDYMAYLHNHGWLTAKEQEVYDSIGREFLHVISTTDMTKVYKMPILLSFLDGDRMRMAVTDEQVLLAWKAFFDTGTNWRDFKAGMTLEDYRKISDRQHLKKARDMPIHFLLQSGDGFFVKKQGFALALREDLAGIVTQKAFVFHYRDIVNYRVMDYYKRRYEKSEM